MEKIDQEEPSPREAAIDWLEVEIDRCEKLLVDDQGVDPEERARLRRQLSDVRDRLATLKGTPLQPDHNSAAEELARWAGNLDPLPSTHRTTARPVEQPSRR